MNPIQWLVRGDLNGEQVVVGGFFALAAAERWAAEGPLEHTKVEAAFAAWQIGEDSA